MTNEIRLRDRLILIHDELRENIKANRNSEEDLEQAIWKTRNKLADIIQDNFRVVPNNDYRD